MKVSKLLSVVVAAASTLFVALSALAEYSSSLTFPSAPATALENFPALVRISSAAPSGFSYADCPTSSCLWFTDATGAMLPFDVDTWDDQGTSLVWVSVPSHSSSTKLTMHWDAAGAPAGQPASSNVWTRAGYNAVWHFSGSNAESAHGLVPSAVGGTPTYNGNAAYPGGVGSSLWLDGVSTLAYAVDPAWTTLGANSTLSVSFWARTTATSAGYARIVSCMGLWSDSTGWDISLQNSFTKIMVGAPGQSQMYTDINPGPNTAWRHFTATYTTATTTLFVDGVSKRNQQINALVTPTGILNIGAQGTNRGANYWKGGLDEIRIRAAASSAEWAAEEYATMTNSAYGAFGPIVAGGGFACELTFPHAPATPLANFPTLVRISEAGLTGFNYADCLDADCIWFEDEGGNVLPFEVDTWDDQGESLVWVSVPSLSSSTTILMRWANSGAKVSPDPTNVWTRASYVGVWHMNELLADTSTGKHYTPDSSGSGWNAYKAKETDDYPVAISDDGIASSAPPTGHAMVNQLNDNNRTTGGFLVPSSDTSGTTIGPFTISFFEATMNNSNDRVVAFGTTHTDIGCMTANPTTTYVMNGGNVFKEFSYSDGLDGNAWRHIAGVYDSTPLGYVGGEARTLAGQSNWDVSKTLVNGIGLGTFVNHTETFRGNLDEIRIRNVASDASWVTNEYATVTDRGYVSFGDVQELGGGAAALEFAPPSASGITTTGATVSARLKSIGDGADYADVWLVVSGFGQTRVFPAADSYLDTDIVSIQATGLQCGAEWTAYLTVTNNLGASTNSASVVFSTLSDASTSGSGLIQAVTGDSNLPKNAAAGWDIDGDATARLVTRGPLAMRSSGNAGDIWFAADGTRFQWADNTGYGYTGYMYMEGGKDYWFGGAIDDQGYVWVDTGAMSWSAGYSASVLGSYSTWAAKGPFSIPATGWYRIVFSSWNAIGGAGAEQAGSATLIPKLRYAAVAPGSSKPGMSDAAWQEALDPGDGSLFIPHAPVRGVSVLSAERDGTLLSAKVAVDPAYANETSELRYVYGATHGGDDPADWEGGAFLSASLPATAATNDWLVGIAANTRYVRFYTTNDGTVNWSQTVSIEWAGETTISDTFVFVGDSEIPAVRADGATFAALLNAPGAAATEAQAWYVVTGGGETFSFPAGTATGRTNLTVTATGLTPETEYTVYCTATNNAATPAGVDSVVLTFTTCGAETSWEPSSAAIAFDGRVITAKVPVTNVGIGTTTLYLMTGASATAENNAIATNVVSGAGVQTLVADISSSTAWGNTVWYSLKLVVVTNGIETIDWPYQNGQVFYNKSYQLKDDTTYTWVGGSAGAWTNTACWKITAAGLQYAKTHPEGYPAYGSTAVFATEAGDGPITVTIPATRGSTYDPNTNPRAFCWFVLNLNLTGMHEPLVFTSEDKTAADCQFRIWQIIANQADNRLVFDDCNVYLNSIKDVGASAADANGENFTITLTGGTTAQFNGFSANRPGVKVRVEDGATLNAGGLSGGTAAPPPVLEIDGGTVTAGKLEPDTWGGYGTMVRLVGAGSVFTPQWLQLKYATSTNVFEFVVPVGGYTAVPVQFTSGSNKFPNNTNDAKMTLRVSKDSPGLASIPGRGIPLLQSAGGINAANVRFEDVKAKYNGFFFKDADGNKYADAAAIAEAGKTAAEIKEIWYRSERKGFAIIMR